MLVVYLFGINDDSRTVSSRNVTQHTYIHVNAIGFSTNLSHISSTMERWQAKILVILAVFLLPFGSMLLPIKLAPCFQRSGEKGRALINLLMCFGGGVFFATYSLHMAPEVSCEGGIL